MNSERVGMLRGSNHRNVNSRVDGHDNTQKSAALNRGPAVVKIPDNYQLPPKDKFKREQSGNFELIFPFNQKTEELAGALNRQVGARASMGAPNFLKMLVQEIKQQNEEYQLFIKNGFRYAAED